MFVCLACLPPTVRSETKRSEANDLRSDHGAGEGLDSYSPMRETATADPIRSVSTSVYQVLGFAKLLFGFCSCCVFAKFLLGFCNILFGVFACFCFCEVYFIKGSRRFVSGVVLVGVVQ